MFWALEFSLVEDTRSPGERKRVSLIAVTFCHVPLVKRDKKSKNIWARYSKLKLSAK